MIPYNVETCESSQAVGEHNGEDKNDNDDDEIYGVTQPAGNDNSQGDDFSERKAFCNIDLPELTFGPAIY